MRHRKYPLPPDRAVVAPFYAPIIIGNSSQVFYRETRKYDILQQATADVVSAFRQEEFSASYVFIATWYKVKHIHLKFIKQVNISSHTLHLPRRDNSLILPNVFIPQVITIETHRNIIYGMLDDDIDVLESA